MGEAVSKDTYTPKQRTRFRERLNAELEVFDKHLQDAEFINQGTIGLELEMNLVGDDMQPKRCNEGVLEKLEETHPGEYQSEIGSYNVEMNHPPLAITGRGLEQLQEGLDERLRAVQKAAKQLGSHAVMIGTLPTLTTDFLSDPAWITNENRYKALNNAILESRGELVRIELEGALPGRVLGTVDTYRHDFEDIAPESACTSMQLHLQVAPNLFANAWNASQAIAGVQAALSANSPLFVGHKLWHESRIPVFQQAIDTRTAELVNQGVRPRVWFGERWITSVFDLFEENGRYFSPLLPEDRMEAGTPIMSGDSPGLHYMNLHNGTIWRWNRPIYDPNLERSHIRVENRLLPAGPTTADIVADAAFYYGLVKFLGTQNRPVWSRLSFEDAHSNFLAGAREGLRASMRWPRVGTVPVRELITEHLLDQAREGLELLDVDSELIETYLGIIEGRARSGQNGATWQLDTVNRLAPNSEPDSAERAEALATMMQRYIAHQTSGQPVHTWSVEGRD